MPPGAVEPLFNQIKQNVPRQLFTEVSCVVCVCGIGTGSLENKEALFRRPLPSYRSSSSAQSRGAVPPTSSSASYYYCDVHQEFRLDRFRGANKAESDLAFDLVLE